MRILPWILASALCVALAASAACLAAEAPAAPAAPAAETAKPPSGPSLEDIMKDPNRKVGFIRKTYTLADGTQRIYQVWVPLDYTPDRKWPVILFLHGAGERGTDGEKVLIQGLPKEIKKRGGAFEFIVVIPQCASAPGRAKEPAPATAGQADRAASAPATPAPAEAPKPRRGAWGGDGEVAMGALRATLREYSCDADRVYLTGLSMGGFGSFSLAAEFPKMWAAVVPICGGGQPDTAAAMSHLPFWVWHGAEDKTMPPDMSRKMVEALKAAGAKEVKYTEVPGVGHNSWDNAYASDELWTWLLAHRLPAGKR